MGNQNNLSFIYNSMSKDTNKTEIATFAAGCFWGVEEKFRKVDGVLETMVGYTGGDFENPTYEDMGTGKTGHAEAIQITYNPSVVSYKELLDVFWNLHDPTQKNKQGLDIGTQYRSAIFFHSPEQETDAHASKEELEKSSIHENAIATEIVPTSTFYKAEEYHQKYVQKTGRNVC